VSPENLIDAGPEILAMAAAVAAAVPESEKKEDYKKPINVAIYADPRIKKGETLPYDSSSLVWMTHPESVDLLRARMKEVDIEERTFSRQEFRSVSRNANRNLTKIAGPLPDDYKSKPVDPKFDELKPSK
jgi:hypothetical protein